MGTLADLTGGFQQGYGFSRSAARQRQLDKLYDQRIDEYDLFRKTHIAGMDKHLESRGETSADYGIESRPQWGGGMTLGEKFWTALKSPFRGQDRTGMKQAEQPPPQVNQRGSNEAPNPFAGGLANGGAIRGYAGPVRRAIETHRQSRTYSPQPNASYADGGATKTRRPRAHFVEGDPQAYAGIDPAGAGIPFTQDELNERAYGVPSERMTQVGPQGAPDEWMDNYITDEEANVLQEERNRYYRRHSPSMTEGAYPQVRRGALPAGRRYSPDVWEQQSVAPDTQQAIDTQIDPPTPEVGTQPDANDPPGTGGPAFDKPNLGGDDGNLFTQDPEIDWSSQATAIPPDEIPRHTTLEWQQEADFHMAMAAARGEDPWAVHEKIVNTQIRNFTNYAYQAQQLMVAGDLMGAARALTAGYQYFPNGSDVKFGMVDGKDGKKYLIGMGKNEQTGEPVGNPYVITPQMLGNMMAQAQDPKHWTQWTKDHHELALKYQQYNLEKDVAGHKIAIDQENARSNRIAANAGMLRAETALGDGYGDKPRTEAEVRAAVNAIKDDLTTLINTHGLDADYEIEISGALGELFRVTGVLPERMYRQFVAGVVKGMAVEEVLQEALKVVEEQQQGYAIEAP